MSLSALRAGVTPWAMLAASAVLHAAAGYTIFSRVTVLQHTMESPYTPAPRQAAPQPDNETCSHVKQGLACYLQLRGRSRQDGYCWGGGQQRRQPLQHRGRGLLP